MRFLVFGLLFLTAIYVSESRHLVKRDTKDDLTKSVEQLRESLKKELDKLKAEGKIALAGGLQGAEKLVDELEGQLKKLDPKTEVGKALLITIEAALEKVKTVVEEEVKKLSGKFYDDSSKDQLKNTIDALKKQAQDAIKKLEAQGKAVLAEEIKKLETRLIDIEQQLEKLNPQTDVGKVLLKELETLAKAAEQKLEEEIKKLSGSFYDAKDDLVASVEALKKKAKEGIDKLKAAGKAALAEEVRRLEGRLVDLEQQLIKLDPQTEVGKALLQNIEKLVKGAEQTLEEDLKKISGAFYEDAKDQLKQTIDALKKQAGDAIKKLEAQGKAALAEEIKKLETPLIDIEQQLEKLNPQTEVGKALLQSLEALAKAAEQKLEEEIKKLSGGF